MSSTQEDDKIIYKVTFYVPPENIQQCLSAIWSVGAGSWPNPPLANGQPDISPPKYTETAFISRGTGQFKPSGGANPHIGQPGKVEFVEEEKVEIVVVGTNTCRRAVKALREAHPYEVCAYFVVRCEDF